MQYLTQRQQHGRTARLVANALRRRTVQTGAGPARWSDGGGSIVLDKPRPVLQPVPQRAVLQRRVRSGSAVRVPPHALAGGAERSRQVHGDGRSGQPSRSLLFPAVAQRRHRVQRDHRPLRRLQRKLRGRVPWGRRDLLGRLCWTLRAEVRWPFCRLHAQLLRCGADFLTNAQSAAGSA